METKKTIAILGLTNEARNPFLQKLAQHYRLLIVSEHIHQHTVSHYNIDENKTGSNIELIDCAKNGCWEADIIILWDSFRLETTELKKLEAVATQKIILILTDQKDKTLIRYLFPHSKIITLDKDPVTKKVEILGTDVEALQTIRELINKTGFFNNNII